jgi:hypothetical protein
MFPNNPSFVDKYLQTKQDDIMRELPDPATYDFQETNKLPSQLKITARVGVLVGALLVLAWWLSTII